MVICSTSFLTLARAQFKALGGSDLPIAVIPHPFSTISREDVRRLAEKCVGDIARLAIGGAGGKPAGSGATAAAAGQSAAAGGSAIAPARRIAVADDLLAFNDECERRRWSDGLPLIPPTAERVELMLSAAGRPPSEAVAQVAPGFGIATVERIAINAVMAGCRPQYLPLLIAAVEAVADTRFNLQGIQATTGSATPWLVVNGPIARELGFNAATNCLGQGCRANATLGRALRLVLQNIGGAFPGEMDRATHGQPGKYTFCCAENEAESPWAPLHVERGYAAHESTITAIGAASTLDLNTHASTAGDLLRVMADAMTFPACNDYHFAGAPWLIISPEHAESSRAKH